MDIPLQVYGVSLGGWTYHSAECPDWTKGQCSTQKRRRLVGASSSAMRYSTCLLSVLLL